MTSPRDIVKQPGHASFDHVTREAYDAVRAEGDAGPVVWDLAHGGPARDVTLATLRLLRGRVLLRVLPEVESTLILIDTTQTRKDSVGRGVVVAMGPAAQKRCPQCRRARAREAGEEDKQRAIIWCPMCHGGFGWIDVAPGFAIGDTVYFVGQHKSRTVEIEETLHAVAQEEIVAVVEP